MKKDPKKAGQPYPYKFKSDFFEPDWKRIPGYKDVSEADWNNAKWQRKNSVQNLAQFKTTLGALLKDDLAQDIEKDMKQAATMSMMIPPQMINTMVVEDLRSDPIRKYMAPAFSERDPEWPSHPYSTRDSLKEHEMWVTDGLTHRYPTKVLAEMLSTCPQYCGHCTRMDLVGQSVPQIEKRKFELGQNDRITNMLEYLRNTTSVRDVVVSGGDIANLPIATVEKFIMSLMDIENIRDIRLASKGLMGLPQHFLQDDVLKACDRMAKRAIERGVSLALHTHINHANSLTPLVAKAARKLLDMGFRDVRNQGVLLRGTNASADVLLDLCFKLLDHGNIMPYYFYMCDMIPNSEHWRVSLAEAQQIQHDMMGYLPGFATPRLLADVPYVGKRWVHQQHSYDRKLGISYWTKNYLTSIEKDNPEAINKLYEYYDPIRTVPPEGQQYWKAQKATA